MYKVLLRFDAGTGVKEIGDHYNGPEIQELLELGCIEPLSEKEKESLGNPMHDQEASLVPVSQKKRGRPPKVKE